MSETKKYLSKIVKGGKTIYMKDSEARTMIEGIDPQSNTASVDTCMSIINELV